MSFLSVLTQLTSYINHQSAHLDDQIHRLERAKQEIRSEQSSAFHEWNRNLSPNLGFYWEGQRAVSFDGTRRRAFQEMQRVFHDEYDDYIHRIDSKIYWLEQENSTLSFARSLTYDAKLLLRKGEEATGELENKINQIRRHLYS